MNKEFVKYEQALALKELGFDEPCFGYYDEGGNLYTEMVEVLKAPLYQQAFRWIREKYNIHAEMVFSEKPDRFYYYIGNMVTGDMDRGTDMSYEEAELECLNTLIQIVKNK